MAPDLSWMEQAKCRGKTDVMYDDDPGPAKIVCFGCPVQSTCLEQALELNEQFGVWGGRSTQERKAILRERRRKRLAEETPQERKRARPAIRALRGRAKARPRSGATEGPGTTAEGCASPLRDRQSRLVPPRRLLAVVRPTGADPREREFRPGADLRGRPRYTRQVAGVLLGNGGTGGDVRVQRVLPRLVGNKPRRVPEVQVGQVGSRVQRSAGGVPRVAHRRERGRPDNQAKSVTRVQIVRKRNGEVRGPGISETA